MQPSYHIMTEAYIFDGTILRGERTGMRCMRISLCSKCGKCTVSGFAWKDELEANVNIVNPAPPVAPQLVRCEVQDEKENKAEAAFERLRKKE